MHQHCVLSGHIFLIGCWSLSCWKLSDQYVYITALPAAARLCVPARLLDATRLYVLQHTPVNRCLRLLCLLISGRLFCVVHASGTIGLPRRTPVSLCSVTPVFECTCTQVLSGALEGVIGVSSSTYILGMFISLLRILQKACRCRGLVRTPAHMSPV